MNSDQKLRIQIGDLIINNIVQSTRIEELEARIKELEAKGKNDVRSK